LCIPRLLCCEFSVGSSHACSRCHLSCAHDRPPAPAAEELLFIFLHLKRLAFMQCDPMAESSKIFRPFRALGLYCNAVPCIIQSRGTETFVTASIGRSFQIFDCAKLTLSFVSSDSLPKKIRALAAFGDLTFTAVGCDIYAWYRGRIKFKMEEHNSQVVLLLCLGKHLVSVCKSSVIHVWDCEDGELQQTVELHTPQVRVA
jgi:hypothetical protein